MRARPLRCAQTSPPAPLAGTLLADTIRYAIATFMTFLTGFVIGWRPEGGITASSSLACS
jgi:hypothetical protein